MSPEREQTIGRLAFAAAVVGTVLGPVHALARYATADGREDLELPGVRVWAEPAADALSPILTWADADTVYLTYGKLWPLIFATALACAYVVRSRRSPARVETWLWRATLLGYALVTLGTFGSYWTPLLDESFMFVGMPGMMLSLLASTALGIALLRRRAVPVASGLLLALWIPLTIGLSSIIALGAAAMPMVWAWGLAGRRIAQQERVEAVPVPA